MAKKTCAVLNDFKAFISKGNVVDMAIGVIIGGAFGKIVSSLVNDVIMPLVGILLGGVNFTTLSFQVKDSVILYGNFIQTIIDFLIIAICMFVVIKVVSKFKKKEEEKPVEVPAKAEDIILLEEIRDLLKKN